MSLEIVVVDNGPDDDCVTTLCEEFPSVRCIRSEANVGFGAANNIGVQYSSGRRLLFLNPDTEIIGGAIQEMMAALDEIPSAGVVGAKLLNSDMSVQTSCVQAFPTIVNQVLDTEILRRHFPRSRLWGNGVLLEPQGGIHEVDAISGACMMLDRHAFEEVGGFDERYFMYSEDVDLCLRIARMGWHNYCVSTAMVTHHGGRSSTKQGNLSFSAILMRQSRFKLFASSKGLFYATVYRLTMALNSVCRIVILRCALCVSHEPNRCFEFRASGQKWMAVLRWALGFEAWAKPSKEEVPQ